MKYNNTNWGYLFFIMKQFGTLGLGDRITYGTIFWHILLDYKINLENEKVMFHYNILFSYWIIQTSQLGSHWKWNGISVSRHSEGACNLVLIQFWIVSVPIMTHFLPLNTNKSFQTVCIWSLYFPWGSCFLCKHQNSSGERGLLSSLGIKESGAPGL